MTELKMLRSGYYRVMFFDSDPETDDWALAVNKSVPTDEDGNQYFGYGCRYNIKEYKETEDDYEMVVLMDDSIIPLINKEDAIITDNIL